MYNYFSPWFTIVCLLLVRLCAALNRRDRANRHLAGRGLCGLLPLNLLPGPAPLWSDIPGYSCQDDSGNQEVNDQVDPVGVAELQADLGPERDNLQYEGIEANPPPVLEEEGHRRQ